MILDTLINKLAAFALHALHMNGVRCISLIVVRGVVISDKSSDDMIGEGCEGQKQVFFSLKGA